MSKKINSSTPSLQDFSTVETYVRKFQADYGLQSMSLGFCFFMLDLILSLQPDEIEDAITDNYFLRSRGKASGHDRGIDAIYVDSSQTPNIIHVFNMKYTESFKNTNDFFPGGEIDKVVGFFAALVHGNDSLRDEVNPALSSKIQEIWTLFKSHNPRFIVHICSNHYVPFEKNEKMRFERELEKYSYFSVQYHLMSDLVAMLTQKGRQVINAKIRAIEKNLFEKSGGDVRALIVEVEARDLIRIVIDDEAIRNDANLPDHTVLRNCKLLDSAFEDNVRVYLRQRSRINQNIKATALGDENHRFFYYNNGITLTCSKFGYPKSQRGPIIELSNIQIVNGGQTVHALYEAFLENPEKFEDIEVLCRIYESTNSELSTSIAEYTNSQNPVQSRDIRSNDFTQKKLEKELLAKGWFYERKKAQHQDKPRHLRIDAEKAGQVLLAFFNEMPAEAKAHKQWIFADKYDEVFNDNLTADKVLLCMYLFSAIEEEKRRIKEKLEEDFAYYLDNSFVLQASYYFLFLLKRLAERDLIPLDYQHKDEILGFYSTAFEYTKQAVKREMQLLSDQSDLFSDRVFFVGNRPKRYLDDLLAKTN